MPAVAVMSRTTWSRGPCGPASWLLRFGCGRTLRERRVAVVEEESPSCVVREDISQLLLSPRGDGCRVPNQPSSAAAALPPLL
jgi:hypothetical protein